MECKMLTESNEIKKVVEIHVRAFPQFFLTSLGEDLLHELYTSFLYTKNAGIIIGKEREKIVGFLAFSESNKEIYLMILRKKFFRFTYLYFLLFCTKPRVAFHMLVKVLKKNSNTEQCSRKKIRISSIATNPDFKNKGVGKKLFSFFLEKVTSNYDIIELETDKDNNENTNKFYEKLNFHKVLEMPTYRKRVMNVYHYYIKCEERI